MEKNESRKYTFVRVLVKISGLYNLGLVYMKLVKCFKVVTNDYLFYKYSPLLNRSLNKLILVFILSAHKIL